MRHQGIYSKKYAILSHCGDCKNPLHLDVVDRYLRRMGDKTIPDEAPPSMESFYRPAARDFWFGFDGICAFTIVAGIFVLLRV